MVSLTPIPDMVNNRYAEELNLFVRFDCWPFKLYSLYETSMKHLDERGPAELLSDDNTEQIVLPGRFQSLSEA